MILEEMYRGSDEGFWLSYNAWDVYMFTEEQERKEHVSQKNVQLYFNSTEKEYKEYFLTEKNCLFFLC